MLVVANKADGPADDADVAAFYRLGLGEPFAVSALHGQGIGDLMDRLLDLLPDAPDATEPALEPRFAIVGRPNVGKSTLFNRLVGADRSVVSEVAGTTRDSVDSLVTWPEHGPVRFIDTAGMRRGTKVRGVEYYSVLRAHDAIEAAHVAVAGARGPGRAHGRGQEDREPRDGRRPRPAARREQVGSGRGQGPMVQAAPG